MIKQIKYLYWYIKSWFYYPKIKKYFQGNNFLTSSRKEFCELTAHLQTNVIPVAEFQKQLQEFKEWKTAFNKEQIEKNFRWIEQ